MSTLIDHRAHDAYEQKGAELPPIDFSLTGFDAILGVIRETIPAQRDALNARDKLTQCAANERAIGALAGIA